MSQTKNVTAIVGQPLQIVLQSNVASTGYGWYLSALDGGIALYGSCVTPISSVCGGPSNHAFDFVALKAGSYKAEFILVAPWRMDAPAQTETYEIEIKAPAKTAAEDIEEAMKTQRFTSADAVSPESGPSMVLKYATPMASPVLKYAAPMGSAVLKYAAPMAAGLEASQPVIVYAAPMASPSASPQSVAVACQTSCAPMDARMAQAAYNMLYAAPMTQPMPLYAAPLPMCSTDPRLAASSVNMLYAAPMAQAGQMSQPAYNMLYAAPMAQPMPMYAAPASCQPMDPRMAMPPFTILYAAPMAQANQMAQAVQAMYAAPMAQSWCAMPPYSAPFNPNTGCCC